MTDQSPILHRTLPRRTAAMQRLDALPLKDAYQELFDYGRMMAAEGIERPRARCYAVSEFREPSAVTVVMRGYRART